MPYFTIGQLLRVATSAVRTSSTAVEYGRPKRLIEPSPVRHGFIPEEWFQAFYSKTGASGIRNIYSVFINLLFKINSITMSVRI